MATTTTLMLDERGRTSFAKITKHRLFTVEVQAGGRIILTPAMVVPAQGGHDGANARQDGGATAPSVDTERVES